MPEDTPEFQGPTKEIVKDKPTSNVDHLRAVIDTTYRSTDGTQFHDDMERTRTAVEPMYASLVKGFKEGDVSEEELIRLLTQNHAILENRKKIDELTFTRTAESIKNNLDEKITKLKPDETIDVYFLDLTRFKHFNDLYGNSVGDELLEKVSKRISSMLENSPGGRLGGDEFVYYVVRKKNDPRKLKQPVIENGDGSKSNAPFILDNLSTSKGTVSLDMHMGVVSVNPGENAKMVIDRSNEELKISKHDYYEKHPEFERRQG